MLSSVGTLVAGCSDMLHSLQAVDVHSDCHDCPKAVRRRLDAAEVVYDPVRDIVRCQPCIWGSDKEFGHIDIYSGS